MRILLPVIIAVAGLLGGCSEGPQSDLTGTAARLAKTIAAEQDHVTVPELSDWVIKDQRDYELVDIRDVADYAAGHIQDARHIPLAALMSDEALAALPHGRKIVVYSNGTAHAAQAALLLRLVERDAYALLGGFNYWQAYLKDPDSAGAAEMDPAKRAEYQAVSCFFEGDYLAAAGLLPKGAGVQMQADEAPQVDADPLGLGLGLGSQEVQEMGLQGKSEPSPAAPAADPLGLGLGLGLGGEAAESLREEAAPKPKAPTGGLLIKAEC
ncbi:MAG: rhodanese-like domain-containing protein [Sedimenticolaceae bacterium]